MGFYIVEAGLIVCVENVHIAMAGFVEMKGAWDGDEVVFLLVCKVSSIRRLVSKDGHDDICVCTNINFVVLR